MLDKKLELGLFNLKIDRPAIIDSVNINKMEWQVNKTVEELIELADNLNHFKRNDAATEQVCQELGDVIIQLTILTELFGAQNIQLFIDKRMIGITNRNKRLKKSKKAGFQ